MRLTCLILAWLLGTVVCVSADDTAEAGSAPTAVVSEIPYKELSAVPSGSLQRVAIVLVFALVIGVLAIWLLRKKLVSDGLITKVNNNRISLASIRRITPKLTIYVVEVDTISYLITQHGSNTQVIRHEPGPSEA